MKLNSKRLVSYSLLAVSAAFILAAMVITEPQVTSGNILETRTFPSTNPLVPTVTMTLNYTFKAQGSISAQNPIEVKLRITDVNVSNLLDYYQAVGFLGAIYNSVTPSPSSPNATNQPSPSPTITQLNQTYGFVKFEGVPDGGYEGESMMVWQSATDVQTFLIPQSWYPWKLTPDIAGEQTPIVHITGASETLSWQYGESNTRLLLATVGFGVLLLQPVVEFVSRRKTSR